MDLKLSAMGVSGRTSWWVQWGCRDRLQGGCNGGVGADFMVGIMGCRGGLQGGCNGGVGEDFKVGVTPVNGIINCRLVHSTSVGIVYGTS